MVQSVKQKNSFLLKLKIHRKDSELQSKRSILFHSEWEILHCPGIMNLSDRQLLLLGQFALCPQAEGALLCRRLLPVPGGYSGAGCWQSCHGLWRPSDQMGSPKCLLAWLGWSSPPHSILTVLGCVLAPQKGLVTLFINCLYLDQVLGFFFHFIFSPQPPPC